MLRIEETDQGEQTVTLEFDLALDPKQLYLMRQYGLVEFDRAYLTGEMRGVKLMVTTKIYEEEKER